MRTILALFCFVFLYGSELNAGVSNGQPVSAAVTNAAFMDKNTPTTFTTALTDLEGGLEFSMVSDSGPTGANQNVTLNYAVTIFTNAGLTSIQNLTFTNRTDATIAIIRNNTGSSITLKNLSGGTAANQINTGTGSDFVMLNGTSVSLYYDTVNSKWQVITPTVSVAKLSPSGSTGTILSGSGTWTAVPTLGVSATTAGTLTLANATGAGNVTIATTSAASSWTLTLPSSGGSNGNALTTNGSGTTSWTAVLANPSTAAYDMLYQNAGNTAVTNLANGSTGQYLKATTSSAPSWVSFTKHTITTKTSTGTTAGYLFNVSGVTTAPTNGATYTNNGHTYTVVVTNSGKTNIWTTQSSAPASSGNLTKTGGTGDSTIAFSSSVALASYSTPSTAAAIWVRLVGGGAGGGGTAGPSSAGAGGGGGAGGYVEKFISSPAATYYYEIGALGGGATAGNNSGTDGSQTTFVSSDGTVLLVGIGGTGGAGFAGGSTGPVWSTSKSAGGGSSGGDINTNGDFGQAGVVLSVTQAMGGKGGMSPLGVAGEGGQSTADGNGAGGYGAGGGGGSEVSAGGSKAGGPGTGGLLDIFELYNGN